MMVQHATQAQWLFHNFCIALGSGTAAYQRLIFLLTSSAYCSTPSSTSKFFLKVTMRKATILREKQRHWNQSEATDCRKCGKEVAEACSECKDALYCSRECQHWDWKIGGHKHCAEGQLKIERFTIFYGNSSLWSMHGSRIYASLKKKCSSGKSI